MLTRVEKDKAHYATFRDDEITHDVKASFADATGRRFIAKLMPDPEAINKVFLEDDGLEEMRIDTTTAPFRKRQKIPKITISRGNLEGEIKLRDASFSRSYPPISDWNIAHECNIEMVASLQTSVGFLLGTIGKTCD
jgi:hypothetical protein